MELTQKVAGEVRPLPDKNSADTVRRGAGMSHHRNE